MWTFSEPDETEIKAKREKASSVLDPTANMPSAPPTATLGLYQPDLKKLALERAQTTMPRRILDAMNNKGSEPRTKAEIQSLSPRR